ncbi:glutathione S-transferase 1-1-like [Anthonomus grandis grandis]|uniref:glutathione S-transferase 1-1-like n=1 Tax=Anthonomus grandis grandis TaxID=2921223 RepID=UPI00216666D8|nr:glutathione S-transferase 1-1-like [Anthonomus grandis grandis]
MPKLYCTLISPPTRAVMMCANVLGVKLELVEIDVLAGDQLKEEFLRKNPCETIPVLEDDDGWIVAESHAINAYLVAKYGKDDQLYPKDYKLKSHVDAKLHFDTGVIFIRGLNISKPLVYRPGGVQPDEFRLKLLKEAFETLDRMLQRTKSDYIVGDRLTIADFSYITSITQWNIFVPYSRYPYVDAYIKRMKKLPFFELNEEGCNLYNELIKKNLKA